MPVQLLLACRPPHVEHEREDERWFVPYDGPDDVERYEGECLPACLPNSQHYVSTLRCLSPFSPAGLGKRGLPRLAGSSTPLSRFIVATGTTSIFQRV